ncbi:hypothetical protein N7478_003176 [Penicillium angulare]|uniref:uncharacterized protein n=1 Tax=Penicillium angulare TaxID=116970 RepID=UPI00254032F7|nr:uncharacterized protein N7478_003176 [Penicillium angulare]KAJ5287490.1 hypothetical protein N7478_003176 [Penicillium angulare]
MFYNFATPRSVSKRKRVNRACSFCRAQRVRCDTNAPCTQCVENNITCSRLQTASLSTCHRETRNRERVPAPSTHLSSRDHESGQDHPERPKYPQHSASSTILTYKLDSTLEFVTRINTFCSSALQLSSQAAQHDDDPGPYRSPFCPGEVNISPSGPCDISIEQLKTLLRIFQTRIHPLIPIMSQEDIQLPVSSSSSETEDTVPTPLQDAITAYTMQYISHSGLHTRLLGLQWKQFDTGNERSRVVGMPYFQRCLAYCTQYAIFETPSLMTLKCFCIMTLFLLDTGQHHTAYAVIGMAVRLAQCLNLDKVLPSSSDDIEKLQIWWTLVHLDFRCSRYEGKPVSEFLSAGISNSCHPPSSAIDSHSSQYYIESLRLTCAALTVMRNISHSSNLISNPGNESTKSQAEALMANLQPLNNWKVALQKNKNFQCLCLDVPENPLDSTSGKDTLNPSVHPLEIQQNTLLELQYHDIIISLHRSFIELPAATHIHHDSSHIEHVQTALKHALATIQLIHSRMSQHDVFYGCSELYQYQWNAVLTLIGFMLAYSSSVYFSTALRHVNLALEVFEFGGRLSDAAARAAGFTRFLRDRVYKMSCSIDAGSIQADENSFGPRYEPGSLRTPFSNSLMGIDEDFGLNLWSWNDLIDSDTWLMSQASDQNAEGGS